MMEENTRLYICLDCRNIFSVPMDGVNSSGSELKCPGCSSDRVEEIPSWTPVGSNISTGASEWEYECQECKNTFKVPVPSSPSQEKGLACPRCGGKHLHRLTASGAGPLYCG